MQTLDAVLNDVSQFSLEDQEILTEILKKRVIEEKRKRIFKDYQEALIDFKAGKTEEGSADDLFGGLDD